MRIKRVLAAATRHQRVAFLVALLLVTAVAACAVHSDDHQDAAAHDLCAGMMLGTVMVMMAAALATAGRMAALVPSPRTPQSLPILDPPPKHPALT